MLSKANKNSGFGIKGFFIVSLVKRTYENPNRWLVVPVNLTLNIIPSRTRPPFTPKAMPRRASTRDKCLKGRLLKLTVQWG